MERRYFDEKLSSSKLVMIRRKFTLPRRKRRTGTDIGLIPERVHQKVGSWSLQPAKKENPVMFLLQLQLNFIVAVSPLAIPAIMMMLSVAEGGEQGTTSNFIGLNNEAVALLLSGDDSRALGLLKEGVTLVHYALSAVDDRISQCVSSFSSRSLGSPQDNQHNTKNDDRQERQNDDGAVPGSHNDNREPCAFSFPRRRVQEPFGVPLHSITISTVPILLRQDSSVPPTSRTSAENYFFIFKHVFRISYYLSKKAEKTGQYDSNDYHNPETSTMLSAILIFNMAMTYHRLAHQQSQATPRSHTHSRSSDANPTLKAIELYSTVLRLVRLGDSFEFPDKMECGGIKPLICCASLNNRSQLWYERGEYALASDGLGHLNRMIGLLRRQRIGQERQDLLQQGDLIGLMFNILFFQNKPSSAPAA